jgi:hypothetical protein
MQSRNEEILSLRARIENFKHTRSWSRGAMIEWCDALISTAEAELDRLDCEAKRMRDSGNSGSDGHSGYTFDQSSEMQRPYS